MSARQAAADVALERRAFRPIDLAPPSVRSIVEADGTTRLRSHQDLEPHDPSLARLFRAAVERRPSGVFLAERNEAGEWNRLTYEAARRQVDALAQAFLDRGLSADRPVMILSGNSMEHGLLMVAGYTAGVPVAPISVAYSVQSQDHAKLRHIASLLKPGLIYVSATRAFAKALAALDIADAEIVAGRNDAGLEGVTLFSQLVSGRPGSAVDRAVSSTGTETIAKFLFTSGSTGFPKAVINTHGMLTANQQSIVQTWKFLADEEVTLIDWLPWNHTFGGNHNFNLVLRHAGALYIDGGKPAPGLIDETLRNLREVSPTIYFNVPAGYAALLPHIESDDVLARSLLARLRIILYAGAALPQDLWDRLEAVIVRRTGQRIPMTSSWGSTETAPLATAAHFLLDRPGNVGVPVPGVEIKLVPSGGKLEVRVRGPSVTPGYWKSPELTRAAFDEENFYRIGDAMRFANPDDPDKGLIFDGRIAEDFKLTTGTWVNVGTVRVGALAAASPVLQDCLVAGEGHDFIGILGWLNAAGCRKLIGAGAPSEPRDLAVHPVVVDHVRRAIDAWNAERTGASQRIARVVLLNDAPSIDANEITDKGYVNQRAGLQHRARDAARLFAPQPDAGVIIPGPKAQAG